MGVSGVSFWEVPCFSGDTHSLSVPPRVVFSVPAGGRVSGETLRLGLACSRVSSSRHRRAPDFSRSGFSDSGHLDYYRGKVRCGGKEESLGSMTTKKKLKLLKGLLSEDLSMFSASCGEETQNGLVGDVQGKLISEAAEVLIKQLQHVRSEEKEMKKKKKMEKAKLRSSRMKKSSSSSSSSSSSESENGEVMDMSLLGREVLEQPIIDVTQTSASATLIASTQQGNIVTTEGCGSGDRSAPVTQDQDSSASCNYGSSCSSSSNVSHVDASGPALTKSIEICMGNKCKKSGAAALLEEFERVVGIEGAVVGCKCMGKCRDGPNVRVSSRETQSEMVDDDSVRTPSNPLCIKVGLEDVDLIVAKFLSEEQQDLGMAPTC